MPGQTNSMLAISQLKWRWFSRSRPIIDFEGFDLASRGPWGSFLLLFQLKSRYALQSSTPPFGTLLIEMSSHLAALGAWITVLALAIDPFTQQLIHPFPCEQVQPNSVARIARANNFWGVGHYYVSQDSYVMGLDHGISTAIYSGLLSDVSNTSSVDFLCSTGKCIFPSTPGVNEAYQTLAVDYSCVDISSEARSDGSITPQPDQDKDTYTLEISNTSSLSIGSSKGLSMCTTDEDSMDTPSLYSFAGLVLQTDWEQRSSDGGLYWEGINYRPFAFACHLRLAVQTIKASIELSTLKETVLSTTPIPTDQFSDLRLISTRVLRNGKWEICTASATYAPDTPVAIQNGTIQRGMNQESEGLQWFAEDCVWSMDGDTVRALWGFLDTLFDEKEIKLPLGPQWGWIPGDPWITKLYRNATADLASVESYVAQLADSITAAIRLLASHYSLVRGFEGDKWAYVYGEALKTETCVQVRWAWVSFPASLVALTIVFLATTVWKFRGKTNRHRAWKSSSLAVLFGGLDEDVRERIGTLGKKSELEKSAKETEVVLLMTDDGWRLGIDDGSKSK